MTKRDFDLRTKENHGERMPSDTRRMYRASRFTASEGVDKVAQRAAEVRALRRTHGAHVAALDVAFRFRAPTCFRLTGRMPTGRTLYPSLYIVERRNVSPLAPMTTVYTFTMPAGAKSRARIKCWNARKVHAPAYAWNYSIVGEVRS